MPPLGSPAGPAGPRPAPRPGGVAKPGSGVASTAPVVPKSGLVLPSTISNLTESNSKPMGKCFVWIGKQGVGKSSICAEFPNPIFLTDPLETGILDLISAGRVPITRDQVIILESYSQLKMILSEIANVPNTIGTVNLEGYTGLEKLVMSHACDSRWKGDWGRGGFLNFQEGPRSCAARDLPEILQLLQKCRMNGKNVNITGHTMVKTAGNAEGAGYDAELPYHTSKEMWQAVAAWAENIGYLCYQVSTEQARDGKLKAAGGTPTMILHRTGGYEAKNKYGINTYLSMDGLSSREVYLKLCEEAKLDPATLKSKVG